MSTLLQPLHIVDTMYMHYIYVHLASSLDVMYDASIAHSLLRPTAVIPSSFVFFLFLVLLFLISHR